MVSLCVPDDYPCWAHAHELVIPCIYAFLCYIESEFFHKGLEQQIESNLVGTKINLLKLADEMFLGIKIKVCNDVSWCQGGKLSRTAVATWAGTAAADVLRVH